MGRLGKGLFFALVGPGGAGKTTLLKTALRKIEQLQQLATVTTRRSRPGEKQGQERYFLRDGEFRTRIRANAFYEYEEVHPGTYYGTPRAAIDTALRNGQDLIADIDTKGACFLRAALPEHVFLIFIAPPDKAVLRERLRARGEGPAATQARIDRFNWEMSFREVCDQVIVNEALPVAVRTLNDCIEAARKGEISQSTVPYYAQVLPVRQRLVYRKESVIAFPENPLLSSELPHDAALRALEAELSLKPCRARLSAGQLAAADFIPILMVSPSPTRVDFQYAYELNLEEHLPDGWRAVSPLEASLPRELQLALLERFQREPDFLRLG